MTLNISAQPWITADLVSGNPEYGVFPASVSVRSSGDATAITTSVRTSSGGNWLSVTPSATTPATLTVEARTSGLAPGAYTGQVEVKGPANTVTLNANLTVVPPKSLTFVAAVGTAAASVPPQTLGYAKGTLTAVRATTQLGGSWLAVTLDTSAAGVDRLMVTADPSGLASGTYPGVLNLTGALPGGALQIPVTLTLTTAPAAGLTVAPVALILAAAPGQDAAQELKVDTGGSPAVFGLSGQIPAPATLALEVTSVAVAATPTSVPVAPATYRITASAPAPGAYFGDIEVQWDGGTLTVPVELYVTTGPALRPMLGSVLNAASLLPATLAPGEIITVFGTGLGGAPAGLGTTETLLPFSLSGSQLLIGGKAAPLLFSSAGQINAIVPFDVGKIGTTTLQVVSSGVESEAWDIPLSPAAPAMFTWTGATGQCAALNQDNSYNQASNPAAIGSVIQLFGTGGGQTIPASTDGVLSAAADRTELPVTVTIGAVDAPVLYHGSAPGEVAGVLQINAVVPSGVLPGPAVSVIVTIGGTPSQDDVSIAVGPYLTDHQ